MQNLRILSSVLALFFFPFACYASDHADPFKTDSDEQAANLTEMDMNVSSNNPLTPALCKLLEACLILKTTDAKTLATHLNRSPATIRTEFQRILIIMNVHCRYAALKTAEDKGWLYTQKTNGEG